MTKAPVPVFLSYAHEDEALCNQLKAHLSLLHHQGSVSTWHDRLILPGMDWAHEIDTHLETASLILLLVSANFFASTYCIGVEMKRALERHAAGEAVVIPILVRPIDWKIAPLAHLQALPTDARPITSWSNVDDAWASVAAGICHVIEGFPLLTASAPKSSTATCLEYPLSTKHFLHGSRRDAFAPAYPITSRSNHCSFTTPGREWTGWHRQNTDRNRVCLSLFSGL